MKDISGISRSIISLVRMVVIAMVRLIAQLTGWGDGFVGDDTAPGPVPVSMDQRIPRLDYGPDLSMMEDEYL